MKPRSAEDHTGGMMATAKTAWVAWLAEYQPTKFYEAFCRTAQGAESQCLYCGEAIYLDIVEGGGIPAWKLADGDYGCNQSPDTCLEGTGSHKAAGTR